MHASILRGREIFVRIDARRFHGVDLFGHAHGAQFGSDPRAHTAAGDQTGDDRDRSP